MYKKREDNVLLQLHIFSIKHNLCCCLCSLSHSICFRKKKIDFLVVVILFNLNTFSAQLKNESISTTLCAMLCCNCYNGYSYNNIQVLVLFSSLRYWLHCYFFSFLNFLFYTSMDFFLFAFLNLRIVYFLLC